MLDGLKDTSIVDVEITFDTFDTEEYDTEILDNVTEGNEDTTENKNNNNAEIDNTVKSLDELTN